MPNGRCFTAEEFVSLKRPHHPAASPDGSVCAFVVAEADLEESRVVSHLWMADAEGEDHRQITFSHEGEEAPFFSPDGLWLAFLSSRPDYSRPEPELEEGEEPKSQLWILPAMGGEARCLTSQREGVRDFDWLPDSSGLIYLAPEPRPKALQAHRFNKQNSKDDAIVEHEEKRRIGVWRVEVDEDGEDERVWAGDFGGMSVSVSPDGKRAVYATNGTGEPNDYRMTDLWMVNLEVGEATRLTERPGGEWNPQWSPDGSRVLFMASLDSELSYSQTRLWSVPAAGGELQQLLPDFDREIEQYYWPLQSPHALYLTASEGLGNALYRLNVETGALDRLDFGEGLCAGFDTSDDGQTIFLIRESSKDWPDLYKLGLRDEPEETSEGTTIEGETASSDDPLLRLSDLNQEWKEVRLGPQRSFRWRNDDYEIEGLLVLPANHEKRQRLPLVVYVHGGPHGATRNVLGQGIPLQWLAQQGYAVLAPNYRGSSSENAAFAVANRNDLGGGDFRDVMAGVDALIAAGIADSDRLAVMGGSYGGYMTNWAISQTDRFRAAVSLFGIFNWITDYSNSEISHFEKEYLGQFYWEDPTLYFERSPFRYVDRIRTPVLIMHGEADPNTFISNSREMYQALKALGRTVSFVRYPREGHGFHEPRHRIDMLNRVQRWLDLYLTGDGEENPTAYRMDQDVPGPEGWTLRVTSVDSAAPAGHKEPEESALVQVVFALSSDRKDVRFELRLEELKAEKDGTPCPFVGVPVKTLDETSLVEGENLKIAFQGEKPPSAFPVAALFRVPKGAVEMSLTVPGFPSVQLPLPRPDKSDEDETPKETEASVSSITEDLPQPGPVQKISQPISCGGMRERR